MNFRVKDPAGANVQFRDVKVAESPLLQWFKIVGLLLVVLGGLRLCSWLIL